MRSLELLIPPVALVAIVAIAMALTAYVVPAAVSVPAKLWLAAGLVLAGGGVAMAGVVAFRRQKTTVNPLTPERASALVNTGIYRRSRNPMYLGFLLALLGFAVFLANWVAALWLPLFVLYMNRFQIQPEERALTALFGQQFVDYCQSVRRWL